jgi:hypothetical protein
LTWPPALAIASPVPRALKLQNVPPSAWKTAAAVLAATALLAAGTLERLDRYGPPAVEAAHARFWEDTYLAVGHRLTGRFPVSYPATRGFTSPEGARGFEEVLPVLSSGAREAQIRYWQFWRTVPLESFQRGKAPRLFPRYDDAGRPLLLSMGYAVLGGFSPFLLFWIRDAPRRAGGGLARLREAPRRRWRAGAAFLLLIALCPFVAGHARAAYSALRLLRSGERWWWPPRGLRVLGEPPTARGPRRPRAIAGLVLGICVLCRASALLLAPGLGLAWLVARRPHEAGRGGHSAASALLLALPYVAMSRAVDHLVTRTVATAAEDKEVPPPVIPCGTASGSVSATSTARRAYTWDDQAAFNAIVAAGGTPSTTTYYDPRNDGRSRATSSSATSPRTRCGSRASS